jgi:hypothetical protein
MNSEVSLLDENIRGNIRTLWLNDNDYKTICEKLKISQGTWDNYYFLNRYGFRDFIQKVKAEKFLLNAETISQEVFNQKSEDNAKILAIKQKEAEFIRETLGKDLGYSKRPDSININVNKNEALDDEQKKRLTTLLGGVKINTEQVLENGSKQGENGNQDIIT